MPRRATDYTVIFLFALGARALAVYAVPWPPFTDPAYYSLVAQRLADGHGFDPRALQLPGGR